MTKLERDAVAAQRTEILGASAAQGGELQLRGRVLDNFGKALVGARVTVAEYGADKPGVVSCTTEADGSFEARGDWKSEQLVVRAMHEECWNAAQRTVGRRQDGLELALERAATIRGVLASRDGGVLPDLSLLLVNQDTRTPSERRLPFRSEPGAFGQHAGSPIRCTLDGSFTIQALRPGRYTLEVHGAEALGVVARVAEIELRSGQDWSGSECNPLLLDLGQPLTVKIAVTDLPAIDNGDTLRVFFAPAPEGARLWPTVVAREYSMNRLIDLPEDPTEIGEPDLPCAKVNQGQSAPFLLPRPGRYQLIYCLEHLVPEGNWLRVLPLKPQNPQYVEVQSTNGVQVLELELDAAEREELARKH